MTENKSVPPGYCRCGACEKVMPIAKWEEHVKDPVHQRLIKLFYDIIDKEFGG